jgi:DNA-binding NtrC family response regulator
MKIDFYKKLKTMNILLIEEDQLIRTSLDYLFKKKTTSFLALENTESAREQLKQKTFDIIICDYDLPRMNGLDFFKLLRKTQPQVMKVLCIPYSQLDIIPRAVKAGIHDFIQKPFTNDIIEKSLARLIKKSDKEDPGIHIDGERQLELTALKYSNHH